MPFEYPRHDGNLRLLKSRGHWIVEFRGVRRGRWKTADEAAVAISSRSSGLQKLDLHEEDVSADLLDWRPLSDCL
jgi:hypothetical protein